MGWFFLDTDNEPTDQGWERNNKFLSMIYILKIIKCFIKRLLKKNSMLNSKNHLNRCDFLLGYVNLEDYPPSL